VKANSVVPVRWHCKDPTKRVLSSTKRISSRCSKHDLYSPWYSWKNYIHQSKSRL